MYNKRLTVSVDEAAQLIGISRGLAYQLVHSGQLPAISCGRRLIVPLKALHRMLEETQASVAGKSAIND